MKHFTNILYVSESSVEQDAGIARAASLALNNMAQLTVLAVLPPITAGIAMPPGGPSTVQLQQRRLDEQRHALESLIAPYQDQLEIRIEVREGRLFLEAILAVLREGYDLLLKPAENPETVQRLFGSDDMHLLRKCPCPVWLTKPGEQANYTNIMAAVDFNPWQPETIEQPLNRKILELASALALSDFATLHLVHAWEAFAEDIVQTWSQHPANDTIEYVKTERARHQAGMERLMRMLSLEVGEETFDYLAPRPHLPKGSAREVIPVLARELEADLLVMGTVGRTGIPGLIIGNTAEAILDRTTCSVLAIKPPGFVTPVTLG